MALRKVSAGRGGIDVIHDIDLDVREGEIVALLGPNGSGKSTTLHVIAGLLPPSHGRIEFCGQGFDEARPDVLALAGVCLVPEGRGIFPSLSVAENLWLSSRRRIGRNAVEQRAFELFPALELLAGRTAGSLSGGEQQMLALARALATDPALLILDELSMGLAPVVVTELFSCIARLAAQGVAVVVVEQFAREVLAIAYRAVVMANGRIVQEGSPGEIAESLERTYLTGAPSP